MLPTELHCEQSNKHPFILEAFEGQRGMREGKLLFQRNGGVSAFDILLRKSEDGPLPYCKTAAEFGDFNQLGHLVGIFLLHIFVCLKLNMFLLNCKAILVKEK
jgi:hypothetical protein